MIYLVSISSENIKNYQDYKKVIDDVKEHLTSKDKVIVITSSMKNSSEQQLEDILKQNINTSKKVIDTILSLKEIESASYLAIFLEQMNYNNILLLPHQIPIVCDGTIEYVEINSILQNLAKCKYLVIPGNYGINRNLNHVCYVSDEPELLLVYIYNELTKRRYKVSAHIYKEIEKINVLDELEYKTNDMVDTIKLTEIEKYQKTLERYLPNDLIDYIKLNKLKLTIGNKFLQGTKIIL